MNNDGIFAHPTQVISQVLNGIPVYSIYGTYDISLIVFKLFGEPKLSKRIFFILSIYPFGLVTIKVDIESPKTAKNKSK